MKRETDLRPTVLVVEDVTETRDGIERLLKTDGYRVTVARDERDAVESAQLKRPHLILVSLAGLPGDVIVTARRIREHAAVGEQVPIVVFCNGEMDEGEEVAIRPKCISNPPRQLQSIERSDHSPAQQNSKGRRGFTLPVLTPVVRP